MSKDILDDSILKEDPWYEFHQLGARSYIFYHGVLGFGLLMAVVMTLTDVLFDGLSMSDMLQDTAVNFITWPIAGFFYGVLMWMYMERQYQKRLDRRQNRKYEKWA